MKYFKSNLLKYILAISLSSIGSEAFKLSSSLYIFKFTGDFWVVSLLYILMQLPTLITYLFANKIIKFLKDKNALFLADILSVITLIIPLVAFFFIFKNAHTPWFSYLLLSINILISLIHSYRFIHLKNIVYHYASSQKELRNINAGFSVAISLGIFISPILSLFFVHLKFYLLIIINISTYLISGFLYLSSKPSEKAYEFVKTSTDVNSKPIWYKWTYIISISIFIGIFLYPKNSGLIPFFKYTNFDYSQWMFYLTILMSGIAFVTGLILIILHNKNVKININTGWLIIIMTLINLSWFFVDLLSSKFTSTIYYIIINVVQQFLFSIMLPNYYDETYKLFSKKYYQKQNSYSMLARLLIPSIITIFITLTLKSTNYFYAYLIYSIFVLGLSLFILLTNIKIYKYNLVNYYNTDESLRVYSITAQQGLWISEQMVLYKYFPKTSANLRILDIGCGLGRTTFELSKRYPNAKIYGIDINKKFISMLKTYNNIKWFFTDISKPINRTSFLKAQKFDLILFSFNGFSNIIYRRKVLNTIKISNQWCIIIQNSSSLYIICFLQKNIHNFEWENIYINYPYFQKRKY
ncbi:methyltransferase domain-containing protein [Mycoplasma sp. AC1221]